MATIVTRAGKGSALTHNEADANFVNLNNAKYEAGNSADLGASTVSANTTTDAFRITQTGTGAAFVVEDSASPDASPFSIDSVGRVIIGAPANSMPSIGYVNNLIATSTENNVAGFTIFDYATSSTPRISFASSPSGVLGTNSSVVNGAVVGEFRFLGSDGTAFVRAATIVAQVDGTPATNSMPGRMVFSTTPSGSITPVERMRIRSEGNVSLGGSGFTSVVFAYQKPITGSSTAYGNYILSQIQSDVTNNAFMYATNPSTQATAFTLGNLSHYYAVQGTIGAGSTVTNQFGFNATSALTGATNNYGCFSNIAAGTGRFNFFANGSANNYFAGNVGIGTTTPVRKLDVVGELSVSGDIFTTGNVVLNRTGGSLLLSTNGGDNVELRANNSRSATATELRLAARGANDFITARVSDIERMRINSAGNVGIGTTTPDASALLDVQSTTKGVRMPNMTTTQKNAIASPAVGLIVFDTTLGKLSVRTASAWETITSV